MSFDPERITRDEERFRAELQGVAEWALADRASKALAQVLVAVPKTSYEGPAEDAGPFLQLGAQRIIGVRIFRAIRAAMAVLSIGYEPESRALDRILVELAAHRDRIQADESGEEARRWLAGEAGQGITAKVGETAPKDLYANLSQEAHGDPRPVWRLINEDSDTVTLGPHRRPGADRMSLLLHASAACDQLVILAKLSGLTISSLAELHAEVKAAWRKAHEEAEGTEPSSAA